MSRTKAAIVVDERREIELGKAENDDYNVDTLLLSTEEGKPVVALLLGGLGIVLMVLSFSLPS